MVDGKLVIQYAYQISFAKFQFYTFIKIILKIYRR